MLSGIGQNSTLTLTFLGQDVYTHLDLPLEVVYVKNITLGCDTILRGSAPSLVLSPHLGIGDLAMPGSGAFQVLPPVPNPFNGTTSVEVILNHSGTLSLSVFNVQGKVISEYRSGFQSGKHKFEIRSSATNLLLLKISDGQTLKTIKLINNSNGSIENSITHTGTVPEGTNLSSSVTLFRFRLGDQLLLRSLKTNYYDTTITDSPSGDTSYTFKLTPLTSIPEVITLPVSDIKITTVTANGDVASDRGAAVTARGFCWSLLPNPSVAGSHTTNGADTGIFACTINGLISDTQYYLRAYATNKAGTAYGVTMIFSTITYPKVSTDTVTGITQDSAGGGGNVKSDGGAVVTARGVCWSTAHGPKISDNHTVDSSGTGKFTSHITGLEKGTVYYVAAYATNNGGTAYGQELSFKTLDLPAVTTVLVYNITPTSAKCDGHVISDGGDSLTVRGICWSLTPHPTTAGAHTVNGTGLGSFTGDLTGLVGNTRYYVRAYVSNTVGTTYGNELDFKTPTFPAVTTAEVTSVTSNSAVSGGQVTSDGGAVITARGVCWSTSPGPTISNAHTTDGTGLGSFVSNLSGLNWGTHYYIRAYATNIAGTSYGEERNFTTLNLPSVTTAAVIDITLTTATSGGNVTSEGGAPVTARGVCWSTSTGPTIADSHTSNGTGAGLFYSNLTGLTAGTLYYIRAYATNIYGTDYGDELTFTTTDLPTVTTSAVTGITQTAATSGGNVTSSGGSTVTARGVCWDTLPAPVVTGNHTTNGTGTGSFVSSITGLTQGTHYYVRAYATNGLGTAYGNELTFTTNTIPTVTTTAISGIHQTSATSGGNVTSDGGYTVTARGICWSTTTGPTTAGSHTTDGSGTGTFVSIITGLAPGTLYYVRAYAINTMGTAYGNELTFTTLTTPTVTTAAHSNVTKTTATSGGNVTSSGGADVTARGVCYGTTSNPVIAGSHTSDGTGTGTFVSSLTALTPGTQYFVRAYATNSVGTAYGNQDTLTTLNLPGLNTTLVTNITLSTASSGGTVITDGGSPVTSKGVCWSTVAAPTTADSHTTDGTGTGNYTSNVTGLTPGTLYHIRAYAINSVGTAYGGELTFTTFNLPSITTTSLSNIAQTTAASGGTITADGGSPVTARGVCWSTSPGPTTTSSHTTDGSGTGTFVSGITGLTGGTQYYVRSYATNYYGTSYGNELTFTTLNLAVVTTAAVINIGETLASSGGEVVSDGGDAVTARGVCWGTTPNPTTSGGHTTDGTGTGAFVSNLAGLTGGTLYYVRAYATNSVGTAYGAGQSFTTLNLPSVTTSAVTIITQTSATLGGNVTSDGGSAVTARGVCWSTTPGPTIANSHTLDGTGTGPYPSYISGLTGGTLYYVRAYATNNIGTAYGVVLTFTTFYVPTATTSAVSNIAQTTATSGGIVSSDGGVPVTARGVCWSTVPNPTLSNNFTIDGAGTGTFVSSLTGLVANTVYYIRAYATNAIGTSYGNELSFTTLWPTCPGVPTVVYEGKTYNTVLIGSQCWFRENLNVGTKINGSSEQTNNGIKEKYCYNDLESNCTTYGGLYQWAEMMQYVTAEGTQGLCPAGWHLPSEGEYSVLSAFLGGSGAAGGPMKEAGTPHWASPNTGATNTSGFSGLPGGVRNYSNGAFSDLSNSGTLWSSTSFTSGGFFFMKEYRLLNYDTSFLEFDTNLGYGVSVRCIKN